MSLDAEYDFIKKIRLRMLIGIALIVGIIGVIGVIRFALETNKDFFMYIVQIASVLVAILMVGVFELQSWISAYQMKIMNKQTELLEFEKKPMIAIFKKRATRNEAFEILSISKYPVRIDEIDLKSLKDSDKIEIVEIKVTTPSKEEHKLSNIEDLEGKILPENCSVQIIVNKPGILTLKASNLYYRELKTTMIYNIETGELKLIERNQSNNSEENENKDEVAKNNEAFDGNNGSSNLIEAYHQYTKKVAPYLTIYAALVTVAAIFLAISEPLKSTELSIASILGISGLLFGFSGFFWYISIDNVCLPEGKIRFVENPCRLFYLALFYPILYWIFLVFWVFCIQISLYFERLYT